MDFLQKWPFFKLFFLSNIAQENVFCDILKRKNVFLGYENKKFKKAKNWHFFKRVNPWIFSKNGLFLGIFFLANLSQQNVLCDILERKNAFLRYKNNKFKKSKNLQFFKGVKQWIFSKNGLFFATFFFSQFRPPKCSLWHSRTKKFLSRL